LLSDHKFLFSETEIEAAILSTVLPSTARAILSD
jgi:hypothetical protein